MSWHKSTYSGSQGDNCVEVDVSWKKSTRSGHADCVEVDVGWKKSTRSTTSQNCVEVNAQWSKSSFSGNQGSCVEYTTDTDDGQVAVRDSKDPDGAILEFSTGSWNNFIAGVKSSQFDL